MFKYLPLQRKTAWLSRQVVVDCWSSSSFTKNKSHLLVAINMYQRLGQWCHNVMWQNGITLLRGGGLGGLAPHVPSPVEAPLWRASPSKRSLHRRRNRDSEIVYAPSSSRMNFKVSALHHCWCKAVTSKLSWSRGCLLQQLCTPDPSSEKASFSFSFKRDGSVKPPLPPTLGRT